MRRNIVGALAVITLTATSASHVSATSSYRPYGTRDPGLGVPSRTVVDVIVFNTPLAKFRGERSRAKRVHRWLITTTDGCSAPMVGSRGRSFDFRLACERHDFAYANYSYLSRLGLGVNWDSAQRVRVDDQFQRDLQESCVKRRKSERLRCDAWAVAFFHAVRLVARP